MHVAGLAPGAHPRMNRHDAEVRVGAIFATWVVIGFLLGVFWGAVLF